MECVSLVAWITSGSKHATPPLHVPPDAPARTRGRVYAMILVGLTNASGANHQEFRLSNFAEQFRALHENNA